MDKKLFKILIVDDNPQNIGVLGNILQEENYTVGFALNGKKAIEILQKNKKYDLVLLDINMPVMDGFETCRVIQEDPKLKEIPVIFLTAYTDTDKIVNGFELGAKDYVTKPFKAQELLARVNTQLQLKHKTDQLNKWNDELEQKVAERTKELAEANAKLKRMDKVKTDFLMLISHEVRTPLNGIIGFGELLQSELHGTRNKEFIDLLLVSAERLKKLSDTALKITELKSKEISFVAKEYNLQLLLNDVCKNFEEKAIEKNITISKLMHTEKLKIALDLDLFKLSLNNILDNAVRYSPEGGEIVIKQTIDNNHLILSISDQGPGFAEEILQQIFELFNVTDIMYHSDGLGLSLSVVKLIMDIHKGKAEARNNNSGAEVTLHFPITDVFREIQDLN